MSEIRERAHVQVLGLAPEPLNGVAFFMDGSERTWSVSFPHADNRGDDGYQFFCYCPPRNLVVLPSPNHVGGGSTPCEHCPPGGETASEPRYTLAEAEILLKRAHCELHGHDLKPWTNAWVAPPKGGGWTCSRCDVEVTVTFCWPLDSPEVVAVSPLDSFQVLGDIEPDTDYVIFTEDNGLIRRFDRSPPDWPRRQWIEVQADGTHRAMNWPIVVHFARDRPIYGFNNGTIMRGGPVEGVQP